MRHFKIVLFLIGLPVISFCQSDWKDGYIITNSRDTLFGQIHLRNSYKMAEECSFRRNPTSGNILYFPKDIEGYMMTNFAYYVSKKIDDDQPVFLEYLVDGKLDLFYIRHKEEDRYFVETDSFPLKEIRYLEEIRQVDGKNYLYESKKHVGLLTYYTKDAPELYERIEKIKTDLNDLRKLAIDYHNIVCKDQTCISFRNREPYTKISIGPQIGHANASYYNGKSTVVENYFAFGFYIRFWSPRINKNLFIRTGAIFSNFDSYNYSIEIPTKKEILIRIPFQFEYVFPTSFLVRPKASLGFDYYTNSNGYLGGSIGAEVMINNNINLSVMYEKEIFKVVGFGYESEVSISLLAGAYYKF